MLWWLWRALAILTAKSKFYITTAATSRIQKTRPFHLPVAHFFFLVLSCWLYFRWFEKLGEIVKDDGYVCIEDVFMQEVQPQQQDTNQIRAHKDKFDSYWKTDIGTVSEYVRYARMYGFELDVQQEITAKTQQFWTLSIAWNKVVIANHYANQNTNRSQSIGEGDHPSGQPDERKPNTIDPVDVGKLNESVTWHEYFFQLWQERTVQVHLLRFKKVAKTNNPVVCVDGEAQVMTNDVTLDGHHGEIPPSSSHHI